jgi:hypothetical protein
MNRIQERHSVEGVRGHTESISNAQIQLRDVEGI